MKTNVNTEPEIEELGLFLNTFNKESDRGAALLAASIIDDWLSQILEAYFINDKVKDELLFGFNAPIGSFSVRTKLAYVLGLIELQEYHEINIIRKIRNEFGHSWKGVSFDSKKVSDECNKLGWFGPIGDNIKINSKSRFNFAVVAILGDLMWRKRLVSKEKISVKKWSNKLRKFE